MKKRFLTFLIFILQLGYLHSDTNITHSTASTQASGAILLKLEDIGAIGSVMEPAAEILSEQINSFGIMLTIIVTLLSIFAYAGVFKPLKDKMDKIDDSIKNQVKNQIIYGIDNELEKATNYAQKRIDDEIKKIKMSAQDRIFEYQNLVYLVNQKIKDDSDKILEKEDMSDIEKLKEAINVQFKYNEIINNFLTKLVSDDFTTVKQTIKALSEYDSIKSIIKIYLNDLCQNGKHTHQEKEEIKKLLKKYYDYSC